MVKNTHYNNETIQQIRKADMTDFFTNYKGFSFKQQGSCYRCIEHNSLIVKDDKIRWYWNSKGIGGSGVIDYLMKVEGMNFQEAVGTVKDSVNFIVTPKVSAEPPKVVNSNILSLPDKGTYPHLKLLGYLCNTRGIDVNIVFEMIDRNKIYEDGKGNVVFLGHNRNGQPKFACIRGTNPNILFRTDCNGSDKRYSFNMRGTDKDVLYVFESPIDVLSHATLDNLLQGNENAWRTANRLSLSGTSNVALDSYIERNKDIKKLIFCLDNDEAGRITTDKMMNVYNEKGLNVSDISVNYKDFKDFNCILMAYKSIGTVKKKSKEIER